MLLVTKETGSKLLQLVREHPRAVEIQVGVTEPNRPAELLPKKRETSKKSTIDFADSLNWLYTVYNFISSSSVFAGPETEKKNGSEEDSFYVVKEGE